MSRKQKLQPMGPKSKNRHHGTSAKKKPKNQRSLSLNVQILPIVGKDGLIKMMVGYNFTIRKEYSIVERLTQGTAESDQDVGSPTKAVVNEPEPSQPSPGTPAPSAAQEPAPSRPSTRKSGRPPARRGGRVGRNQYTRDRDMNGNGLDVGLTNSPRRGASHDNGADSPRPHVNGGESGKPSRPRYMHPQRTTMNEMKRRVAGILEFISRMQVEMAVAGENSSLAGNGDRPNGAAGTADLESGMPPSTAASEGGESGPTTDGEPQPSKEKEFKELSSVEMMDVLTRHLMKWQQEYGRFGER